MSPYMFCATLWCMVWLYHRLSSCKASALIPATHPLTFGGPGWYSPPHQGPSLYSPPHQGPSLYSPPLQGPSLYSPPHHPIRGLLYSCSFLCLKLLNYFLLEPSSPVLLLLQVAILAPGQQPPPRADLCSAMDLQSSKHLLLSCAVFAI